MCSRKLASNQVRGGGGEGGHFVKSQKKCFFVMLYLRITLSNANHRYGFKVVKESFFEIPISSLILCSYWLLGSPLCGS